MLLTTCERLWTSEMLGGIPAPSTPSHLVKKQQSLMQGGTGIREQPKMGCST